MLDKVWKGLYNMSVEKQKPRFSPAGIGQARSWNSILPKGYVCP